jgi:hypothetical protein
MWPPKSPDLTSPDVFLWGLLKDRVYAAEIRNITEETLQRVTATMQTRVEACLLENGGHFQHLL